MSKDYREKSPSSGYKPSGYKSSGNKPSGGKSYESKSYGSKPFEGKPYGDKPQSGQSKSRKPEGQKAFGSKDYGQKQGGRPDSQRKFNDRQTTEHGGGKWQPQEGKAGDKKAAAWKATDRKSAERNTAERQYAAAEPQSVRDDVICGRNAVLEALKSGRSVNRVLLADNTDPAFAAAVFKLCKELGVPCRKLPKDQLAKLAGSDHHGVAAEVAAQEYVELEDILALAESRGEAPLVVLLDGVEDPHNLGAIIRTALCAGAHGIVIGKHRAVSLNQTVMKTSAGAASHLPVARVTNINQALRTLKDAGCWICAADMDGETLWDLELSGPLALVMGGEGQGVSPLVKRNCDMVAALPMSGPVGSLNVSVSAAVLLYEVLRQRRG